MADNGKLYPAFDEAYAKENTRLCSKADLIIEYCIQNEKYDVMDVDTILFHYGLPTLH